MPKFKFKHHHREIFFQYSAGVNSDGDIEQSVGVGFKGETPGGTDAGASINLPLPKIVLDPMMPNDFDPDAPRGQTPGSGNSSASTTEYVNQQG